MPYIDSIHRLALNEFLDEIVAIINVRRNQSGEAEQQAGHVNYCIAYLISQLLKKRGLSYAAINEIIGALECCKLELYRRIAAPYEDIKMKQNGDIFESGSNG